MKIGIAQIRPRLGKIDQNLDIHIEMIQKAKAAEVDLLVFPELSLTGYYLLDLSFDVARKITSEEIETLIAQAEGIDLVFGFVEHTPDHQLYNTAIYASEQKRVHKHRKVYLPAYGMFDEARYFGAGKAIRSFGTRLGRIGLLIGEDAWHFSAPYLLAMDGAELIVIVSNSPTNGVTARGIESRHTWNSVLKSQAFMYGTYMLFANRVGNEDGVSFYGGSAVVDPLGQIASEAPLFQEQLLTMELDLDLVRQARFHMPILRSENIDLTMRELNRIQKQQIESGVES